MNIQKVSVGKLQAAAYNPRKQLKPGDAEYEKLKRSITEFGYVEPVIWNQTTGNVVGGHQRLQVMKDLGYTEVDCVIVELDDQREKALNIALNKIQGEWDKDKLAALLTELDGSEFDVTMTGFDVNTKADIAAFAVRHVGDVHAVSARGGDGHGSLGVIVVGCELAIPVLSFTSSTNSRPPLTFLYR